MVPSIRWNQKMVTVVQACCCVFFNNDVFHDVTIFVHFSNDIYCIYSMTSSNRSSLFFSVSFPD